jgi:mono/diheme cytochrome c family protein
VPFWSDNAFKTRWFSVPKTNLTIAFSPTGNWSFPTGTVWIKHFELELTNGVASSRKRLETRLLVRNSDGVYGATYRWGNSQTNATLVPEEGLEEAFTIHDGGTVRTQRWHYPSRSQCLQCHTPVGGFALGFNTAQLNRDYNYSGHDTNQIYALSDAGYFQTRVNDISSLVPLAHATNTLYSIEHRARSSLHANCAQCHQPGGAGLGNWDARITTPLSNAGIIDGALVNNWGNPQNRVLKPGSLTNSMIHLRPSTLGSGRMPPLGSTVLDTQSIALLSSWITNMLTTAKQNPTLTWNPPAAITYGMALTTAQLSATANVSGTFSYNPAVGTILQAGPGQRLSVTFVPQDSETYNTVSTNVPLDVNEAPLTITAEDKIRLYGQTNPPLTARYNGFVNGDDPTRLSTPVSLSTTAGESSPAGTYPITANGATSSNYAITHVNGALTVQSNSLPSVAISAPTNDATFLAPASVSLQAAASDSDGTITLVEFFQGTNKLGQDAASPYTMTWSNVAAGSYTLTARATDNQGKATDSAPVIITVQTNGSSGGPVYLSLEAESATLASPMTARADTNASGGQYIVTTSYGSGRATFDVNLPVAGTYFLWSRVLSVNWENSFFVSVDGAADIYDTPQDPNWKWSLLNGRGGPEAPASSEKLINPRTFQLTAGQHTFVFSGRELNTRLDRIVITDDPNFVPAAGAAAAFAAENPESPKIVLRSITAGKAGVRIRFSSTVGASHKIEASYDSQTWHDLNPQPAISEATGLFDFFDPQTDTTCKFYRIRQD